MPDAPATLKIGMAAEGPMPIVVVVDEDVTEPAGFAFRDMVQATDNTPGPTQLKPFRVPLEIDSEGAYVFGDLRPAGSSAQLLGPTPPLHKEAVTDMPIAEALRLFVGNVFYGERVELRVPPGTKTLASALDAPLLLKGELGDIDIISGTLVCLDVTANKLAPEVLIADVSCVYGVVPSSGRTEFSDIDELRVRIERAPEVLGSNADATSVNTSRPDGKPVALIDGTKFLELECGPLTKAFLMGTMVAAHVHVGSGSVFLGYGADVMRLGKGWARRLRDSLPFPGGEAHLIGSYGALINAGGPSTEVLGGAVGDLFVHTDAPELIFDRLEVQRSAHLRGWGRSDPLMMTTFNAKRGWKPIMITTLDGLPTTGDWVHADHRFLHEVERLQEMALRQAEILAWAGSPSAKYQAALDADRAAEQSRDSTDRVRDPKVRLDGFGADFESPSGPSRRGEGPASPSPQARADVDGPDLGFGFLN